MSNEEEVVETPSVEDTQPLEMETPETEETPVEDVEALKQKNKELFARAKKAEEEAKKLRTQPTQQSNKSTEQDDVPLKERIKGLELAEKKRQFGYQHNLSPEETDNIFRVNPNPNADTLKDPFIQGGLEKLRAKKRVESATPSASGRSTSINGKSWGELKPEERTQANYEKMMQSLKK